MKVSRQNIAHLVKTGQLPILRKIPNGYLFFKGDVDEYIMKKNIGFEYETREIYGHGSTYQSLEYFKNNLAHKKNIDSIYIYYEKEDAALDGFYLLSNKYIENKIIQLNIPNMIIRYDDGDDAWFNGVNCGYNGSGPNGSMDILRFIGVDQDIIKLIPIAKWIKIYFDNGAWNYEIEKRDYEKENKLNNVCSFNFCMYNMKLVVLCDFHRGGFYEYNTNEVIEEALSYIPNPKSISLYSKETALKTGHYAGSTIWDSKFYQIVIADESGRELWLDYYVSTDTPIKRQSMVMDVFSNTGIPLENQRIKNMPNFIKKILNANVIVNDYFTSTKE